MNIHSSIDYNSLFEKKSICPTTGEYMSNVKHKMDISLGNVEETTIDTLQHS